MNERVNVKIVIEHAGPDWIIEKNDLPAILVGDLIEHARYVAPIGATLDIKVEPVTPID